MAIADKDELKKLLGDPGAVNVSDAELNTALAFGDSEVIRRTGVTPSEADPEFPSFKAAAELFAMSQINRKFSDLSDAASRAFRDASAICDSIGAMDTDVDEYTGTPMIEVGEYNTTPLNDDVAYEFATKTKGGSRGPSYKDLVQYGVWML